MGVLGARGQGVYHALEHPGNRNQGRDEGHATDSREADANAVVDSRSRSLERRVPAMRLNNSDLARSGHAPRQASKPDNTRHPLSERSQQVDRSEAWQQGPEGIELS